MSACPVKIKAGLVELLGTFSGFDPALAGEAFEDSGDEIGTVAVFRVRHFIDLADETFWEADGDLRHAGGTRSDFTFFCHVFVYSGWNRFNGELNVVSSIVENDLASFSDVTEMMQGFF